MKKLIILSNINKEIKALENGLCERRKAKQFMIIYENYKLKNKITDVSFFEFNQHLRSLNINYSIIEIFEIMALVGHFSNNLNTNKKGK